MTNLNVALEDYILTHSIPQDPLLQELERITYTTVLHPRMLSGHIQGQILYMITRMINPLKILEIGTFTGYSAICMARGLEGDGELHTYDINDEIADLARSFFARSGVNEKIHFHLGDARVLLKESHEIFDMVFIDGEKKEYPEYYELVVPLIRPGGFMLADNVLWGGKIVHKKLKTNDWQTQGIKIFNEKVQKDERVENVIFPFRDGLMVIRKK